MPENGESELEPALSPVERPVERRALAPPLPLGEGRGEGGILLVDPGPGYVGFMPPASFARLPARPEGMEAEIVVL